MMTKVIFFIAVLALTINTKMVAQAISENSIETALEKAVSNSDDKANQYNDDNSDGDKVVNYNNKIIVNMSSNKSIGAYKISKEEKKLKRKEEAIQMINEDEIFNSKKLNK